MRAVLILGALVSHAARHGARGRHRAATAMCDHGAGRLWEPLTPMTPEFASVAQAQFEVLGARLQASRAAIYFRREDPRTGALEFVPAAVWPATQKVWIVGEGVRPSVDSPPLPGGTDAGSLMPSYPFLSRAASPLPLGRLPEEAAEAGLSVPLVHGSDVLGMLAIWRAAPGLSEAAPPASPPPASWTKEQASIPRGRGREGGREGGREEEEEGQHSRAGHR